MEGKKEAPYHKVSGKNTEKSKKKILLGGQSIIHGFSFFCKGPWNLTPA
jgi:hypothetical protein